MNESLVFSLSNYQIIKSPNHQINTGNTPACTVLPPSRQCNQPGLLKVFPTQRQSLRDAETLPFHQALLEACTLRSCISYGLPTIQFAQAPDLKKSSTSQTKDAPLRSPSSQGDLQQAEQNNIVAVNRVFVNLRLDVLVRFSIILFQP